MITLRPAAQRGMADHGWLRAAHTFSFADYHDPAWTHFRSLRVLNEDVIQPGQGFGMHPHRDMEILTWVLSGALRHTDSMGHSGVLGPGEVQVMSAGTGVMHSEVNPSASEPVHLLQIWILPDREGLVPRYAQREVDRVRMRNRPLLIAGPPGSDAVVDIHQDARIHAVELGEGDAARHRLDPGRAAWVQVSRGALRLGQLSMQAGDGAAIHAEDELALTGTAAGTEALLFDLA